MPKYRVYLRPPASYSVDVESDVTPDSDDFLDELHTAAMADLPTGVCHQCAGYGQKWSLDIETTDMEVEAIDTEDGTSVYEDYRN